MTFCFCHRSLSTAAVLSAVLGFLSLGCPSSSAQVSSPKRNSSPAATPQVSGGGSAPSQAADPTRQNQSEKSSPSAQPRASEAAQGSGAGPKTSRQNTASKKGAAKEQPPRESAAGIPDGGQKNPFPRQIPVPEFPQDLEWLNVEKPLKKEDVKGKFVLLDFWTYCCINCMHILPELEKLEEAYPNELVVIGVHSAKFETEKVTANIEEAILRYEIKHPVINDANHKVWDTYGVQSWPTIILIDPAGNAVWGRSGEFKFKEVDDLLRAALPYYRAQKLMDEKPLKFALLADKQPATPLQFPGKVLADATGQRLFISDSNHNRIVIAQFDGKLLDTIGNGARGRNDGGYAEATFDHPQGMTLFGQTLYIADTENHLIRKVDLAAKQVTTIAGTGVQARHPWPGLETLGPAARRPDRWVGPPRETAIASPWDLWIHEQDLYIAMAGPHQIWKMPLDESEIGPYAGNGREDIVDGPLLPSEPYQEGFASFAQPSGLSSDGEWLYVADSEGSSIRAVPFDPKKEVRTVVGTSHLPYNRLFHFGDRDGGRERALLQHCLGVAYHEGQLYVADTYNNKIKVVNLGTGATRTFAGTAKSEEGNRGEFDEPGGLTIAGGLIYVADTNNHRIRTVDLTTRKVETLEIQGLTPPTKEGLTPPAKD